MKTDILFIQGGGNDGYEEDAKLVASLQQALGADYNVHYPQLFTEQAAPDFGWPQQIGKAISQNGRESLLVAHSLGASMLLKYLSENEVNNKIKGIFLISTPFWKGEENWVQGLKLEEDFADRLAKQVPIFLYHAHDDEDVPIANLSSYAQALPQATVREIVSGGHQLNNDLTLVAKDIKSLC